ncbi:MAG TPA: RIP metalloprotease RseP [Bacteroidales bacterium]|nr:RIP metalloprotease RseP [Bacteroidales bacterium]HRZ48415.1 RIP metalloprotease RseP [Bacteroidales bacterium]
MEVFIKIAQLLTSLSILVLLHEMGHFLFARLFKTRVEKFYLFFNPWFSIFKFKKGETTYGLGWLPLGGYVKIAGMIDESMDKEAMKQPAQPWEFRSKPAWQRLFIMLGGIMVNLLLGFIIYWLVLFTWGETRLPVKSLTDGVWVTDSLGYDLGLRDGDKIVSMNGREIEYFNEILPEMAFGGTLTIDRQGERVDLPLPKDFIGQLVDRKGAFLVAPRMPFIIAEIPDTSINAGSGLEPGDRLVKVGDMELKWFDQFLNQGKRFADTTVSVLVMRHDSLREITARIDSNGKFQVKTALLSYSDLMDMGIYEFKVIRYGFFASIPAGFRMAWEKLSFYVKQIGLFFKPETGAYKGLGGFGTITNMFPGQWHWESFWNLTAFLSLILAFMNVLPIPALDGGHVLFLIFEMITGRKPGDKFMEYAQIAGMVILFGLLIYANGMDVLRGCQ